LWGRIEVGGGFKVITPPPTPSPVKGEGSGPIFVVQGRRIPHNKFGSIFDILSAKKVPMPFSDV